MLLFDMEGNNMMCINFQWSFGHGGRWKWTKDLEMQRKSVHQWVVAYYNIVFSRNSSNLKNSNNNATPQIHVLAIYHSYVRPIIKELDMRLATYFI